MRRPMVAGNWKMNGRRGMAAELAAAVAESAPRDIDVLLCPPFPYLSTVVDAVGDVGVTVGAQNLCAHSDGAFTGEVSGEMLAESGCTHVLVGHSERRSLFGETSAQVASKFRRAQDAGLVPILCLGETLDEREAGRTSEVLDGQLQPVFDEAGVEGLARAVIAYEPVWAIGTGRSATPEQAQETHAWLRARVSRESPEVAAGLLLLYGGSVKADNAASLFGQADIDGGLIGGASLEADSFLAICKAATAQQ